VRLGLLVRSRQADGEAAAPTPLAWLHADAPTRGENQFVADVQTEAHPWRPAAIAAGPYETVEDPVGELCRHPRLSVLHPDAVLAGDDYQPHTGTISAVDERVID
jgi:hypothetical protein